MARIAGVNIPTNKRVPIALTYITGIGNTSAKAICEAVGIDATVVSTSCPTPKFWLFASTSMRTTWLKAIFAVRHP